VAQILQQKGFDAYVIAGGLRAWRRAGYPLEAVPKEDMELLPRFD
jgi:rhodanese-related sulfurtransferase